MQNIYGAISGAESVIKRRKRNRELALMFRMLYLREVPIANGPCQKRRKDKGVKRASVNVNDNGGPLSTFSRFFPMLSSSLLSFCQGKKSNYFVNTNPMTKRGIFNFLPAISHVITQGVHASYHAFASCA